VKGIPRRIYIKDILSLQLKKIFRKGCQLHVDHVEDPENTKGPSLENYSVLQYFEDVFQYITGLTSNRDIDFSMIQCRELPHYQKLVTK
jgi:hypothetical protein